MTHPAGDWYAYPDGPEWDEPEFTGRCPRCGAFLAERPNDEDPSHYVVWEVRAWTNPATGYEEWGQVQRDATAEEVAAGRYDEVYGGEPLWRCAKCGHAADYDGVHR